MSARGEPLAGLTEAEAEALDLHMNEHMYQHSISNSYSNFACDVRCQSHHKHPESCPGITQDGEEAAYQHGPEGVVWPPP